MGLWLKAWRGNGRGSSNRCAQVTLIKFPRCFGCGWQGSTTEWTPSPPGGRDVVTPPEPETGQYYFNPDPLCRDARKHHLSPISRHFRFPGNIAARLPIRQMSTLITNSHVTLRRDSLLWLSSQYCSWPSGLKGSQYSDCLGRDCPTVFSTGSNNTWPANKQKFRLI